MILVFGKSGQLAVELARDRDVQCVGRAGADLSDPASCAAKIRELKPKAVINAAAFTDVDGAETQSELAHIINGDAPAAMATACAELAIPFVHISTDYVFEGTGSAAHTPDQTPNPQSDYGHSKLAGEVGIAKADGNYAILRTSWVVSSTGKNFVKTMLALGDTRNTLTVVADQIGGPTPADSLAKAALSVSRQLQSDPSKSGVYHFSGAPDCSWAEFARAIFDVAGISCNVTDIPSSDFPRPATRPLNSRLDCHLTETVFGLTRPDWRAALVPMIEEIKETT